MEKTFKPQNCSAEMALKHFFSDLPTPTNNVKKTPCHCILSTETWQTTNILLPQYTHSTPKLRLQLAQPFALIIPHCTKFT